MPDGGEYFLLLDWGQSVDSFLQWLYSIFQVSRFKSKDGVKPGAKDKGYFTTQV